MQPKEIRKNYMRSWFPIDFVACLPVNYVELAIKYSQGKTNEGAKQQVKILKIFRMLRLAKLLRVSRNTCLSASFVLWTLADRSMIVPWMFCLCSWHESNGCSSGWSRNMKAWLQLSRSRRSSSRSFSLRISSHAFGTWWERRSKYRLAKRQSQPTRIIRQGHHFTRFSGRVIQYPILMRTCTSNLLAVTLLVNCGPFLTECLRF